jgi:hypothetical protein
MECVIAMEFLRGRDNELVAKEVAIVSKNVKQTHHFMSPFAHYFYNDTGNGLDWDDGFLSYDKL